MAIIGCLGDIVFEVSEDVVETLDKIKWSGSARWATHQRHLTNALTEFCGIDPDKITFSITLASSLGVDPMEEMVKIWSYERSGKAVPLVIGSKAYGKYRWSITKHSSSYEATDRDGNVTLVVVSISLQEYLSV